MHGANGLTCAFEKADHFLFREMCAVHDVGIYGILEITCLNLSYEHDPNSKAKPSNLIKWQEKIHNLALTIGVLDNSRILRSISELASKSINHTAYQYTNDVGVPTVDSVT
jgi:hypothetical protein